MKRFMAVGCSHGIHADENAIDNVLSFARYFEPHTVVHLGDAVDFAVFRKGATGGPDALSDTQKDLDCAKDFLGKLFDLPSVRECHYTLGNHEDRVYQKQFSPNGETAFAAKKCIEEVEFATKSRGGTVWAYDNEGPFPELGGCKFMHGFMFSENAVRDHAEVFGDVCMAHVHTVEERHGRRSDHPVAMSCGGLATRKAHAYAKTKKARMKWSQGLIYGEYTGDKCYRSTMRWEEGDKWRLIGLNG